MAGTSFGVATALIGLLLVLRGYPMIRGVISLFGALVGFVLGAALTAQVTHTSLFQSQTDLIGGSIGAVVCGLLAFFVYKVAMIGGLAAIGFTLGTSLMVALHVTSREASLVAGILTALALAVLAWRLDLPGLILVILTVLTGASATTLGTMVAMGRVSAPPLRRGHGGRRRRVGLVRAVRRPGRPRSRRPGPLPPRPPHSPCEVGQVLSAGTRAADRQGAAPTPQPGRPVQSTPMSPVVVTDNPAEGRYEGRLDGVLAGFAEYQLTDDLVVFTHTEVDEAFEGRGVGSAIARAALDQIRSEGRRKALPVCPFITGWIQRHPEYLDITYGAGPSRAD